jgi:hypothetical protein
MENVQESRASRTIREAMDTGRPVVFVQSVEEKRVERVLDEVSRRSGGVPVWTWTVTEGMRRDDCPAEPGTEDPRRALDFIIRYNGAAIFNLKDFHEPLKEAKENRRRMRDVYAACLDKGKFCVISAAVRYVPEEIERSLLFLELRPPDLVELTAFLRDETGGVASDADYHSMARALQGLTLDEARYAIRRALAAGKPLGTESLPSLLEEKKLLSIAAASSSSSRRPRTSAMSAVSTA